MITTEWVRISEYLEYRYKGPKWIGRIIIKLNGKKINSITVRFLALIFTLFEAKLQYRNPPND